jgi:hypothetical protein
VVDSEPEFQASSVSVIMAGRNFMKAPYGQHHMSVELYSVLAPVSLSE